LHSAKIIVTLRFHKGINMSFQEIVEYIAKEWGTIVAAPVTVATFVIIASGLAYKAATWKFSGVIETLRQQLAHKDQLIEGLKERVEMMPAPGSPLSRLSHSELKTNALKFVHSLREWLEHGSGKERLRQEAYRRERQKAVTTEDKQRLWDSDVEASNQSDNAQITEYNIKFKGQAILLRDELMSRTPRSQNACNLAMYDHVVNTLMIQKLATDLEGLALLLK
jgi:hypothetical protein